MRPILPMLLGATLFASGLVPQTPPDAPAARGGHAMTYDSEHRLVLMFGGGSRQQSFNDLWAWNGERWQRLADTGPSARNSAAFAYDSKRRQAVVVGGRSAGGLVDDTWEWDGTIWREPKVSGPGVRLHHFAAFDARRGRLVLYGGLKPIEKTVERLTDTWEWDGMSWTRRDTEGFAAFPSSIAYDEERGQVVVMAVDATAPPDGERPSAMWAWDGIRWTRVGAAFGEPTLSPSQPLSAGPDGLVMLDGAMHKGNVAMTWLWRGGRWLRSDAAPPTPQRVSHAMAYDTVRKRVVMFGGHAGFMPGRNGEMFGDTWEWTGASWERVHPR
jgi:Kelch motif